MGPRHLNDNISLAVFLSEICVLLVLCFRRSSYDRLLLCRNLQHSSCRFPHKRLDEHALTVSDKQVCQHPFCSSRKIVKWVWLDILYWIVGLWSWLLKAPAVKDTIIWWACLISMSVFLNHKCNDGQILVTSPGDKPCAMNLSLFLANVCEIVKALTGAPRAWACDVWHTTVIVWASAQAGPNDWNLQHLYKAVIVTVCFWRHRKVM